MKVLDLEPQFVRHEERIETWTRVLGDPLKWKPGDPTEQVTGPKHYRVYVDSIEQAQGIYFLCPACYAANGGLQRTHVILCWFKDRGVPANVEPLPGRWQLIGTGYHDLTLGPGENGMSSVQLLGGGCKAHFHVHNGLVTMCR